jgi:hypothetical protein
VLWYANGRREWCLRTLHCSLGGRRQGNGSTAIWLQVNDVIRELGMRLCSDGEGKANDTWIRVQVGVIRVLLARTHSLNGIDEFGYEGR